MNYISTRSRNIHFETPPSKAVLDGLANDGGLYVPVSLPHFSVEDDQLFHMDYHKLAQHIMKPFFSDFSESELMECIASAYDEKFEHSDIVPVTDALGISFLELQHGPTQAFKDMALSILPHLMRKSMKIQSDKNKIVILAATSGDTGKAALEGFKNVEDTIVIVFYPKDGVSEIQKKQMCTQQGKNTFVIALDGNFDDAQTGVKNVFNDKDFNDFLENNGFELSSANSINIGRLVPQIVYYYHGYLQMCRQGDIVPGEKINIAVPTGNFGNILAAYYAKETGLPINKLICASNDNNVLFDFFKTGVYDKNRSLTLTISPSMDILVSSNLERLLYELSDHDTALVADMMESLKQNGSYHIPDSMKSKLHVFYSNYATEKETCLSIDHVFRITGHLLDTHTAVAHSVYEKYLLETGDTSKTMIVSTASPFKFGKSVFAAIGEDPNNLDEFEINKKLSAISGVDVPRALKELEDLQILHERTCKPEELKTVIEDIIMGYKGESHV